MKKLNNTNYGVFFLHKIKAWTYNQVGDNMDKVKELDDSFNHGITLAERKNVVVTGVKKNREF